MALLPALAALAAFWLVNALRGMAWHRRWAMLPGANRWDRLRQKWASCLTCLCGWASLAFLAGVVALDRATWRDAAVAWLPAAGLGRLVLAWYDARMKANNPPSLDTLE